MRRYVIMSTKLDPCSLQAGRRKPAWLADSCRAIDNCGWNRPNVHFTCTRVLAIGRTASHSGIALVVH